LLLFSLVELRQNLFVLFTASSAVISQPFSMIASTKACLTNFFARMPWIVQHALKSWWRDSLILLSENN